MNSWKLPCVRDRSGASGLIAVIAVIAMVGVHLAAGAVLDGLSALTWPKLRKHQFYVN
jgi:hypothetical protein